MRGNPDDELDEDRVAEIFGHFNCDDGEEAQVGDDEQMARAMQAGGRHGSRPGKGSRG